MILIFNSNLKETHCFFSMSLLMWLYVLLSYHMISIGELLYATAKPRRGIHSMIR